MNVMFQMESTYCQMLNIHIMGDIFHILTIFDVYEDINVVVEKIKELKTDDWDLKKYYVMGNEHGDNRLCVYVKVYDQDSNRYYYKQGTCYKRCASIPVNEV